MRVIQSNTYKLVNSNIFRDRVEGLQKKLNFKVNFKKQNKNIFKC